MTYELTINEKPGYLHVVVTGRNTKENVRRYLEAIVDECKARGCFRVLIEERLEGPRLGTLDVYEIVSGRSSRAERSLETMAYVDVNARGELMKFAENVAVNRGLRMTVFPTVAEAEKWLQHEDRGDTAPEAVADADKPRT